MRYPNAAVRAIFWSQWAYWCALAIAIWAYISMPLGGIRTVLILTPILPGLLIFSVTYWIYKTCDEFIRLRTLQAATVTAMCVAVLSMIYFFLELLGFPKLSMMWIHIVGWSIFDAQILWLMYRSK
jgi:uncharacterized membrane protein